jgi:hypothetical protein
MRIFKRRLKLKENNKQIRQHEWGHKVLRIVNDDSIMNKMVPLQPKKGINHIIMDDLQYEHEILNGDGWRFQTGFALDDDSFYLFYKKPLKKEF